MEAARREKRFKNWCHQWKIELIEQDNPTWRDLYEIYGVILIHPHPSPLPPAGEGSMGRAPSAGEGPPSAGGGVLGELRQREGIILGDLRQPGSGSL